jgi:hypothetical protein
MTNGGVGYTSAPSVVFTSSSGSGATATATISNGAVTSVTVTNSGTGYTQPPAISFVGGAGHDAAAVSFIETNIDKAADSFADNNAFKEESVGVINFDESNPFGEINNA